MSTPSYPPDDGVSYRWRLVTGAASNVAFVALAVAAWKFGAHDLALVIGGAAGVYRAHGR